MRVLILGAKGMLGTDLNNVFGKSYRVTSWDQKELDITREEAAFKKIIILKPQVVINAAAYTAVDDSEKNQELAFRVNGEAVGYLARACARAGALFIHFSTDYVFDGKKKEGYTEEGKTNPINVYGKSKESGELQIKNLKLKIKNFRYYLIRTSWLYGKNGKNFVETMLELVTRHKTQDTRHEKREMRNKIRVVNDQFGKPTYTVDLAKRIMWLVKNSLPSGIYHVTNEGVVSWYEFARKIFELALRHGLLKHPVELEPCTSQEFPRPAPRPQYSALLNTKLPPMRKWEEALEEYLNNSKLKIKNVKLQFKIKNF